MKQAVLHVVCALALLISVAPAHAAETMSVDEAMDAIVTRLYEEFTSDELAALNEASILQFIRPAERDALATRHVHFQVNVPVVVSVMREIDQPTVPFWLSESGFQKTALTVTNTEDWVYEVWQKEFPAGEIGLGINGFDKHRPHYFVTVGPHDPAEDLALTELSPAEFDVAVMREGAFVYHDWDSLLLKDVPEALEGQQLLTTIRGRARTAHLIGGFRQTPYPASALPDQVVLSWTEDPKTTQTFHWRGSTDTTNGVVRYREADSNGAFESVAATRSVLEDLFLANDRYCHRYEATVRNLSPGTHYAYQVGFPETDAWSETGHFRTAPADDVPFNFIVFGDTQSIEPAKPVIDKAVDLYPDAAFQMIAGDVVSTGQYRDDWDRFFHVAQDATTRWPLMPALGNHDIIDGLGAGMWRASHALPAEGPMVHTPERTYAFEYSNALFLVLDSGLSIIEQAPWIEEQLANSDADWKIAIFHFPPYNHSDPYPEIASLWGYLFDKYGLDIAFEGHYHHYLRTKPIFSGRPQPEGSDGTVHLMTIAIPGRERKLPSADFVAAQFTGIPVFEAIEINGKELRCRTIDRDGNLRDEFKLRKN